MQTEQSKTSQKACRFSVQKTAFISIKNPTKFDCRGLSYLKDISKQVMYNRIEDHARFLERWRFSSLKQGVLMARLKKDVNKAIKACSKSPDNAPKDFLD